jgi:hypothetical protein
MTAKIIRKALTLIDPIRFPACAKKIELIVHKPDVMIAANCPNSCPSILVGKKDMFI